MLSISKISADRPLWRRTLALGIRYYKPMLAGFFTAGAALGGGYQPLILGLVWALSGQDAAAAVIGAMAAYLIFWRQSQLLLWILAGWLFSWLRTRNMRYIPWLREALGAAVVSSTGLLFQLLGDNTSVGMYLLRVALGTLAPAVFLPLLLSFPRNSAQVRLELAAGILEQSRRVITDIPAEPIDEPALIQRARERACGSCPAGRFCRDRDRSLPENILKKPLVGNSILAWQCREPGRLLLELRRSQEQLRLLKADRQRCTQYRQAVWQQYGFLSDYLRKTADSLTKSQDNTGREYDFETAIRSNRSLVSGDKCLRFGRFVLLCDGMGTGPGAARDARFAADFLRKLLTAGFPADSALQSFNALCSLSLGAGAVTVDLARVEENGRVSLYKWGAGKSYLLKQGRLTALGETSAPPGMGVTDTCRKTSVSLRRGEVLILCSDGVRFPAGETFPANPPDSDLKNLARQLLARRIPSADDATLAVIRLTDG